MLNFIKNLFGLSLKSKVMKVLNKRFEDAQKAFDADIKEARTQKNLRIFEAVDIYRDTINQAKLAYTENKCDIEAEHLDNLLAKLR